MIARSCCVGKRHIHCVLIRHMAVWAAIVVIIWVFAFSSFTIAFGEENENVVMQKPQPKTEKTPPDPPSKQWIFDQSRYTNSPVTGTRVLQYRHNTPAFRDPNAFYNSPHESYPFSPAPYGPYPRFAPPRYYGSSPYDQFSLPYRPYSNYGVNLYGP